MVSTFITATQNRNTKLFPAHDVKHNKGGGGGWGGSQSTRKKITLCHDILNECGGMNKQIIPNRKNNGHRHLANFDLTSNFRIL